MFFKKLMEADEWCMKYDQSLPQSLLLSTPVEAQYHLAKTAELRV